MSSSNLIALAAAAAAAYYYFYMYLPQNPVTAIASSANKQTFYRAGRLAGGTFPAPSTSPATPASSRTFYNNRKEGFYRATSLRTLGIGM